MSAEDEPKKWGITVWGLSYHINRSIDYNEDNWGAGVRYYTKPDWHWLGTDQNNRLFVEADALRNSWGGVVLPVSAGLDYSIVDLPAGCKLSAVGALTLAYYRNPVKDTNEIKVGPVPGATIGCGRVKTHLLAVLSPHKEPLAAIVASVTIMF